MFDDAGHWYNFVRVLSKLRVTPAMEAGITARGGNWRTCWRPRDQAKKLAEIAPGVGKNTTYTLLAPPKDALASLDYDLLSPVGKRELAKRFRRFGPKKIVESPLPGDSWA
jgi:hypothetical protein